MRLNITRNNGGEYNMVQNNIISSNTINNPYIDSPSEPNVIFFKQSRETMIDTELYSRFIYSCENTFRRSSFYRAYKNFVMSLGLNRDQKMPNINSDMATLEMHHNLPSLKQGTIMITEHLFNTVGYATTFEVLYALEQAHRNHWFAVIMLTKTNHEAHHSNPNDFISIKQCFGFPMRFIETYKDGMTMDIAYNILLHLKLEEQYGESYNPQVIKARDSIMCWQTEQQKNMIASQFNQQFIPMNTTRLPVFY